MSSNYLFRLPICVLVALALNEDGSSFRLAGIFDCSTLAMAWGNVTRENLRVFVGKSSEIGILIGEFWNTPEFGCNSSQLPGLILSVVNASLTNLRVSSDMTIVLNKTFEHSENKKIYDWHRSEDLLVLRFIPKIPPHGYVLSRQNYSSILKVPVFFGFSTLLL